MKKLKVFTVLISACASSSRYIAAPTAPPPDLGISSKDDNLSVTLNFLILPDGSGAWVKGARWDEYVLTIRSICDKALTVEKIRLIDPRGSYIESGADPEQLETLSEAMAEQYKDIGISVAILAVPSALGVVTIDLPGSLKKVDLSIRILRIKGVKTVVSSFSFRHPHIYQKFSCKNITILCIFSQFGFLLSLNQSGISTHQLTQSFIRQTLDQFEISQPFYRILWTIGRVHNREIQLSYISIGHWIEGCF